MRDNFWRIILGADAALAVATGGVSVIAAIEGGIKVIGDVALHWPVFFLSSSILLGAALAIVVPWLWDRRPSKKFEATERWLGGAVRTITKTGKIPAAVETELKKLKIPCPESRHPDVWIAHLKELTLFAALGDLRNARLQKPTH